MFDTFPRRPSFQKEYRLAAGPIGIVDGINRRTSGTLGAAYDYRVRFALQHDHHPEPASLGGLLLRAPEVTAEVIGIAQQAASHDGTHTSAELARACWALALLTEEYRRQTSPEVYELRDRGQLTTANLMAIPTDQSVSLIRDLHRSTMDLLDPILPCAGAGGRPATLGPTFDGSALCPADGDLIVDGILIDLKSGGGPRRRNGDRRRYCQLPSQQIYQLACYALFDFSDSHHIEEVSLISARYHHMVRWPLQDWLSALAGHRINLEIERATMRRLLTTGTA